MKTRKLLITILILALLVVYYFIGTDYMNQRNQKGVLAAQISDATAALALIPVPPADLDEQLASAQDNLDATKNTFAIDTNDTRIVNSILRLADENGVKAIPLSTQSWMIERVLNQDYSVFRVDMAISGNYTQMAEFLYRLENSEPKTLILEYLSIEKAPGCFLLEDTIEGPINANIRIAIYAPTSTD